MQTIFSSFFSLFFYKDTHNYFPSRFWLKSKCTVTKPQHCIQLMAWIQQKLVSWSFEPSQQQRITSGLNTNFILSQSYSPHRYWDRESCFFSLFLFRRHSTQEPASSRVTYFILWAYTGTKKLGEFWKKCRYPSTRRVELNKDEIPGSKRSMYGYVLIYSGL